ncbi:MAG: pyruvate, phosphate dikinase [Candidatus Delongbacteria bacterium]|nr:pyruvate, phosphate dikinase [Candidatus Delongbacteria bacterium]
MTKDNLDKLTSDLKERAKELNCLYEVQELLSQPDATLQDICPGVIQAIQNGWQYPDVCQVSIKLQDCAFQTDGFVETEWFQSAEIMTQNEAVGIISVYYLEERPQAEEGPFNDDERKLLDAIAAQLGNYLFHQQLKEIFENQKGQVSKRKQEWDTILELLERTDIKLLIRISRKMVNSLCWSGIQEAEPLLELFSPVSLNDGGLLGETNFPFVKKVSNDMPELSRRIFEVASQHLSESEILTSIQKWIQEDRSSFLVDTLEDTGSTLAEISSVIERYYHLTAQGVKLSTQREMSFRVSLIRRMLSDQPSFFNIAKNYIHVKDFNVFMQRIIYPQDSHGKLGGKSAGLFLAKQILVNASEENELFKNIKTPKTWYITSDGLRNFTSYNYLEDIVEQKYKDIAQVRKEYPYVVHVFKNSAFDPEIVKGLSLALNDFGPVPLIIRSSSLLEDRLGTAFAGKYKSLFIANQGTMEERLNQLMDAISEVYASTFGPDPIEYRSERGLLDYHEEMGIMIQEVVGKQVGDYFFPALGGVAFSHNEFRWSSRIKREDGLIRIVPGLGTRAVDRLSDDYPIMFAPGQPRLRINVTHDEIVRYSPRFFDAINLKTRTFETVDIRQFLKKHGAEFPYFNQLISVFKNDRIQPARPLGTDFEQDYLVVTMEGLLRHTSFVEQIYEMLKTLNETYDHPIDIEFAHDGENLYLLQCRTQSYSEDSRRAIIPRDIPPEKLIFSANRYVTNGLVSDITHLVYVVPQQYSEIADHQELLAVGRTIGRLNQILPKRQFILLGPGRWGSRGDIKLGVSVTYSEINNTSMLIEIARQKKDYVPDLSFGTHFFQDLVEANIRYLPLYPDDHGIVFNEEFLEGSPNILTEILPDAGHLEQVIRVIDITAVTNGNILKVLMNAEEEEAVAIIAEPSGAPEKTPRKNESFARSIKTDVHWRWRLRNVEGLAANLDTARFGVKGLYLFGRTKNATAGPGSDIDILIHFDGTETQRLDLMNWLEGWSLSLSQMNYMRTGIKTDGLLDIHLITDEDIASRTSYAAKIGAVTDAARPLALGSFVRR